SRRCRTCTPQRSAEVVCPIDLVQSAKQEIGTGLARTLSGEFRRTRPRVTSGKAREIVAFAWEEGLGAGGGLGGGWADDAARGGGGRRGAGFGLAPARLFPAGGGAALHALLAAVRGQCGPHRTQ